MDFGWLLTDDLLDKIKGGFLPVSIIAAMVGGIYTFLMKRYLDKFLEKEKAKNSVNLEGYKHRAKNIESFLERDFEAVNELYEIRKMLLPDITDDMSGDDIMTAMIGNIDSVVEQTRKFVSKYFPILPPDVVELLEDVCSTDQLSGHTEITSNDVYTNVTTSLEKLKANFDGNRPVNFKYDGVSPNR